MYENNMPPIELLLLSLIQNIVYKFLTKLEGFNVSFVYNKIKLYFLCLSFVYVDISSKVKQDNIALFSY